MKVSVIESWQEIATQNDALIIGLFSDRETIYFPEFDDETKRQLQTLLKDQPKLNQFKSVTTIHTLGRTPFKRL